MVRIKNLFFDRIDRPRSVKGSCRSRVGRKKMRLSHPTYRHLPFTASSLIIIWSCTCLSCWSLKLTATPKNHMLATFQKNGKEVGNGKKGKEVLASTAAIAALLACFTLSYPRPSFGENALEYGGTDFSPNVATERALRRSALPQGTGTASGKDPILQGLVYFLDDAKPSLSSSDTLVVVAHRGPTPINSGPSNMEVIAGAKIKLLKIRFPVLLNMYEENIINPSIWEAVSSKEDVYIDAWICPTIDTLNDEVPPRNPSLNLRGTVPCTEEQSIFQAHGLAKLISNLPELPPEVTIRAAASLQLQ